MLPALGGVPVRFIGGRRDLVVRMAGRLDRVLKSNADRGL